MADDRANGAFGPEAFVRMWSGFATKMMEAGMAFSPQTSPPDAVRQVRSSMLRAWADYCDQFMRSGEFLDMLKRSLDGAIQARQQLNNFLGQMQHNLQGTSRQDVDGLMACLQRVERRVLDESDRLSDRLEDLSQRLARLEQASAPPERLEVVEEPEEPEPLDSRPAAVQPVAAQPKRSPRARRPAKGPAGKNNIRRS